MTNGPGTLFVIATPIGNLEDLSPRASMMLARVDTVAAEDTRRAGQLLTRLGISQKLVSLHEHNEAERVQSIVDLLQNGRDAALISDAGTPLISDPGYRLLAALREQDLPVSPIPGCCAAIAALSVAGLPTDRFRFEGFLPARRSPRRKRLLALRDCQDTLVFYESARRAPATLADVADIFGADRPAALAREMTKLYETLYRGRVVDVRERLTSDPGGGKGECTLVVAGAEDAVPADTDLRSVLQVLLQELPASQAASLAARIAGVRRAEAYRVAQALREHD